MATRQQTEIHEQSGAHVNFFGGGENKGGMARNSWGVARGGPGQCDGCGQCGGNKVGGITQVLKLGHLYCTITGFLREVTR
jgi:hypothetical protein